MDISKELVEYQDRLDQAQEWIWGLTDCLSQVHNECSDLFTAELAETVHQMIERAQIFVLDLDMGAASTYSRERTVIRGILGKD